MGLNHPHSDCLTEVLSADTCAAHSCLAGCGVKTSRPPTRCPLSCQPSHYRTFCILAWSTDCFLHWAVRQHGSHKVFCLLKNMYFLNIMPTPHGIEAVFYSQHGHILKGYRTLGWGGESTNSSSQMCIPVPLWVPSHTLCDGYPGGA